MSKQNKKTTTKSSGKKKRRSKQEKKEAKERKKRVKHRKTMIEWKVFKREFLNSVDNCQYRWDLSLVKKNGTFSRQTTKNGKLITKRLYIRIKEMRKTLRDKLSIDQKKKLAILRVVVKNRHQWLCKPNEAIEKKSYLCVDIDTILNEIESEVHWSEFVRLYYFK